METYGEISNLLKEIESDSAHQVKEILSEAESFAEEKIKKAEREATIRERRIIKEAEKKAQDIKKRILSNVNMEISRFNLRKKEEIISAVIEKVQKGIDDFVKSDKYNDFLLKLLEEILKNSPAEKVLIVFDEADRDKVNDDFINKVISIAGKYKVNINKGDITFEQGIGRGVIVKLKGKHLIYNNTLKDRFERLKDEYRLEIYEELFGA